MAVSIDQYGMAARGWGRLRARATRLLRLHGAARGHSAHAGPALADGGPGPDRYDGPVARLQSLASARRGGCGAAHESLRGRLAPHRMGADADMAGVGRDRGPDRADAGGDLGRVAGA